jgi:hypothetical protein
MKYFKALIFVMVSMFVVAAMDAYKSVENQSDSKVQNAKGDDENYLGNYDPLASIKVQALEKSAFEASTCMHGTLKTYLFTGNRDRENLVAMAIQNCGRRVRDASAAAGLSNEQILVGLKTMANEQLDMIVKYGR